MDILFCVRCGKRVSEEEVEQGKCAPGGKGYLCTECTSVTGSAAGRRPAPRVAPVEVPADALPDGDEIDRESAIKMISVSGAGAVPAAGAGPAEVEEAAPGLLSRPVVIVPLAVVVGMAAAVLLFRPGGGGNAGPEDAAAPADAPPAVVRDESPAAKAFDKAVSFAEVNPTLYREQAELYAKVVAEHADSRYAEMARKKIKALEEKLPQQLFEELAIRLRGLVEEDKYPEAKAELDGFLQKYGGSPAAEHAQAALKELVDRAVSEAELTIIRAKSDVNRGDFDRAEEKLKVLESWSIEKVSGLVSAAREEAAAERKKREDAAAAAAKLDAEAPEEFKKLETAWAKREYTRLEGMAARFRADYGTTEFCRKTKKKALDRMLADCQSWRDIKAKEKDIITDGSKVEILYRDDWEGAKEPWNGGKVVAAPGRGKVYEVVRKPNQWTDARICSYWKPHIPLARDGYLSFYYYLNKPLPDRSCRLYMSNGTKGHNGFGVYLSGKYGLEVAKWTFFAIPLEEWASGKDINFTDEDLGNSMSFSFKPYAEDAVFRIDDVTITKGGYPTLIRMQVERAERHRKEMTSSAMGEPWYHLTPAACRKLRQLKREGVKAKSIMLAGGGIATKSSFVGALGRSTLTQGKGYKFHPPLTASSSSKGVAEVQGKVVAAASRLKPETVFIAIGMADLKAGRGASQVEAAYKETVQKVMDAGAVPVLVTLAIPRLSDPKAQAEVAGLNRMVLETAKAMGVPAINAYDMLNSPDAVKKAFSGGNVRLSGFKMLNEAAAALYAKLEKHVYERGPKEPPLKIPRRETVVDEPIRRPPSVPDAPREGPAGEPETEPPRRMIRR